MKKLLLPNLMIFLFSQLMFAQLESFDLSKYKLPEIKRKQLELNFNLSESSSRIKSSDEFSSAIETQGNFNNITQLRYVSFVNRANYQGNQDYFIRFSPRFNTRKYEDDQQKESLLNSTISVYSENRFYFGKQFFFEVDVNSNGALTYRKNIEEPENSTVNYRNYSYDLGIPLMAGKGRIEPIQDARLAIYVFEELQKQGRLTRIPSDEEILEFSRMISRLKNERYFDYRLRRIAEIEQVDSFLQAKAFVNQADARYFTSVYDNWEYSEGPVRQTGTRFSAGIAPLLNISRYFTKSELGDPPVVSETDNRFNSTDLQFIAEFIKETPINLYWQRSIGVSTSFELRKYRTKNLPDETEDKYKNRFVTALAHYKMAYYPNSRTSLSGMVFLDAFYEKTDHESDPVRDNKSLELGPGFAFELNYYVSPQLRLSGHFGAEYVTKNKKDRYYPATDYTKSGIKRLQQSLNIIILYRIF